MLRFLPAFIFLLFIAVTLPAHSQEYPNLLGPSKITTIGYWNNGQAAKYHVKESSASFKGKSDKAHNESVTEYDLKLKVTDSTETAYVFEMTYSNFVFDENVDKLFQDLGQLQSGLAINYRTNELGQFDTILNLPALKTELLEKLALSKSLVKPSGEKEDLQEIYGMVIDNMIKNLEEIESVEALFLGDIIMLHGFYGMELVTGKTMDIVLEYPTLGDVVLSGTGTVTLNAINKTADECSFSTSERPDREEMKEYIYGLALLFMLDSQKKISMEDLKISMSTKKKMKMELSTGWMTKVVNTSTTKLTNKKGEQRKVSVTEYVKQ